MSSKSKRTVRAAWLFGCVSAVALSAHWITPAHAQEAQVTEAAAAEGEEEVTVTASRVNRKGFEAPTPTTMINADLIKVLGNTDMGSALSKMPSFQADQNSSRNPLGSSAGRVFVNLRNLGSQRTLVLMDGQRLAPSALTGQTDLNVVPVLLVDRVDVVTGGASAQWGSDAVAGVVNMITKKSLDGYLTDFSFGISDRNDNIEEHAGVAWGTDFAGDRGRFIIGGEWVSNGGVGDMYTRDWGREEWGLVSNTAWQTNGLARTLVLPNVRRNMLAAGGVITSGPFAGTTFGPDGQPRQFVYGSVNGGAGGTQSGGDGYAEGDGQGTPLKPEADRGVVQFRVGYDITPDIELFAQMSANYLDVRSFGPGPIDYAGTGLIIRSGNPYIPTAMQNYMTANNIASFGLNRYWKDDVGNGTDRLSRPLTDTQTTGQNYILGAKGAFGDTWTWDAYAQYSTSLIKFTGYDYRVQAKFYEAVDAVLSPTGQIVCRSTLTNPGNGCVPVNVLGQNSVTPEAFDYFTSDQHTRTRIQRVVQAANMSGEPFSTWAGPVSVAFGLEHRFDKAGLEQEDPIALANGYNYGNTKPVGGSLEVTEGYLETVIPLLADVSFAKSLEFNGAVRFTNYSTSGNVTTWKAGLNYAFDDSLRFRVNLSRDIRAANISELYTAESFGSTNIINPATGGNLTATTITSGNTGLRPEESTTFSAGFAFTPDFLPEFKLSVDYYQIEIKDVISSVSAQTTVNYCYEGNAAYCALVTYTAPEIAIVRLPFLNLAGLDVKGVDVEAAYRFDLAELFADTPGSLSFAYYLTYQPKIEVDNGTSVVNRAGDMGVTATPYGGPKVKWSLYTTYELDAFSATFGVRFVGGGKYNVTYTSADISDNSIDSATYYSLALGYDLSGLTDSDVQIYGSIQNLTDLDPPVDPINASGNPFNATFHDVIGRTYMVGVRARF